MTLQLLLDNLLLDTRLSLPPFAPELVLCVTIVALLLARVLPIASRVDPLVIAMLGAVAALLAALPEGGLTGIGAVPRAELFTGLLVYDSMSVFLRILLLAFTVLFLLLSRLTGIADRHDGQDFYVLVLGGILGMCLMVAANHLMTLFLAVEMASVPSYVLTGIVKGRQRASEAALKYAVYGAGAAGVMLYGISLLAGVLGTAHLPTIGVRLAELNLASIGAEDPLRGKLLVLAAAAVLVMVGLAFKLSAVPFHFWAPDVFEGASAEVGAFLSVASKTAALGLLVRLVLAVCATPAAGVESAPSGPAAPSVVQQQDTPTPAEAAPPPGATDVPARDALAPVREFVAMLLAVTAAITCTFGNLAAYGQTNIKRMLAYSTIAHAGYLIMPIAAAAYLAGDDPSLAREAITALLFYAGVYLFMNLGAFAVVALVRNEIGSESIKDYAGLVYSSPTIAISMAIVMFSLLGLPPLAGFWGKLAIFRVLALAGSGAMLWLLVIAALNTALSLVYYLRVAKVICMDSDVRTVGTASFGFLPILFVVVVTAPLIVWGVLPERLAELATQASSGLL